MKKQFISIFSAVILLIAGVAMTGCNKNEPDQPAKVQTYHVSIQAGKGDANQQNGPRKALGLDENTLTASWASGERVSVRNLTKNADLGGYLVAESPGVQTTISGDLTGTINAGDELQLTFLSPDYTNQRGTIEDIATYCDYAVATIHVESVTWGSITFEESIADFHNRQAIAKFTLKNKATDATLEASDLVVEVDNRSYNIHPASATSEIFVALPGFTDKTIKLTATVGSDTYTYTSPSAKSFEDGKYYAITVGLSKKVNGFSISPTQQIEFAHGNLQYNHSAPEGKKWRIAREQYDYVGNWYRCYQTAGSFFRMVYDEYYDGVPVQPANVNGTVYENDFKSDNTDFENEIASVNCWVDYFGWNTANNPLNISYYPEDYSTSPEDFVDWGHNLIYDPKADITYPADTWRTPTATEWDYIFCERENAAQLFGFVTLTGHPKVDRIQGIIIFPDGFEVPSGFKSVAYPGLFNFVHDSGNSHYKLIDGGKWPNTCLSKPPVGNLVCPAIADTVEVVSTNEKFIFNQNILTLAEWAQLEAQGAVFLPAAGVRKEYNHKGYVRNIDIGFLVWYWSSTHQGPGYKSAYSFEASYDDGAKTIHPHGGSRVFYDGLPVRLVRDL